VNRFIKAFDPATGKYIEIEVQASAPASETDRICILPGSFDTEAQATELINKLVEIYKDTIKIRAKCVNGKFKIVCSWLLRA